MGTKSTSTNKKGNRTEKFVSKAECIEESKDMINGDLVEKQEEYWGNVVDLSNLELSKNNLGNQGSNNISAANKKCSHHAC